jgi:hypothetical protein
MQWNRVIAALAGGVAWLAAGLGGGPSLAQSGGTLPQAVVVDRPYGAALHSAPAGDARTVDTASCGDILSVIGASEGWLQVNTVDGALWLGGARVTDAASPSAFNCGNAITFYTGDDVTTSVASGCLSLRHAASRSAEFDTCVDNGHHYTVVSGPVDVDGEDWLELTSPETGSGWSLADFLRATRRHDSFIVNPDATTSPILAAALTRSSPPGLAAVRIVSACGDFARVVLIPAGAVQPAFVVVQQQSGGWTAVLGPGTAFPPDARAGIPPAIFDAGAAC